MNKPAKNRKYTLAQLRGAWGAGKRIRNEVFDPAIGYCEERSHDSHSKECGRPAPYVTMAEGMSWLLVCGEHAAYYAEVKTATKKHIEIQIRDKPEPDR